MNWFAYVLPLAMGAFALAMLLNGWRLLKGPSLADRVLALDTLFINLIAFLILAGIRRAPNWSELCRSRLVPAAAEPMQRDDLR